MRLADAGEEPALLYAGSAELGLDLDAFRVERLIRFLNLLYQWNRAAGLTTVARGDAVRLHLLDSLAALPFVQNPPCLDLGTGAGLPGVALALAAPGQQFVLVESNRKRCSFLHEARRVLELGNCRIVESAVESLPPDVLYPTVISRAFRAPSEFLSLAKLSARPGGRIIAMMANPSDGELADLGVASGLSLAECRRFTLPGGKEPRVVAAFQKPVVSRETL